MTNEEYMRKLADMQTDISAYKQEPSGDLISRQAVLDMWRQMICYDRTCHARDEGRCTETVCDFKLFEYQINHMPSVKPQEPKTGHWIEHPEIETSTPEYLMFYECSECGDKQCFCKSDIHKKHFCNNCGARMVEPQEGANKYE